MSRILSCVVLRAGVAAACGWGLMGSLMAQNLSLDMLYRMAIERDPTVRASRSLAVAAQERVSQAQSQKLPQVVLSMERMNNTLNLVGREDVYFSANRTLQIRQPIYRPLVADTALQAASQQDEAQAQREASERDLLARLSGVVFEHLYAVEQLSFVHSLELAASAQVKAAEQALAAGSGMRTDIDEARARLDAARVQGLQVRLQIDATRRQVERLVGQPGVRIAPLQEQDTWEADQELMSLNEMLSLAELRPEVRALQARLEAARAEVSKVQSGYRPTVDALARWVRSDGENVFNPNGNYRNQQVGVMLNWPLYEGGMTLAAQREAQARVEESESRLQALREDLATRIETQHKAVQEGQLRIRALRQAMHSAQQALVSSQKSFLAGYRTRLDVLNAEQAYQQARRDLAQGRLNYLLARIQLSVLVDASPLEVLERQRPWFRLDADPSPAVTTPVASAGNGS